MSNVTIHCLNKDIYHDFPKGTTLLQIQKELAITSQFAILNARVNNKAEALDYEVYGNKTVEFVDISTSSGMRCYVRSLCFILAKAVAEVLPNEQMNIEHGLSRGYFCKFHKKENVNQDEVDLIKKRMREIVDSDIPFIRVEEETEKVVKMFRDRGFEDKAILLETSGALYSKYSKLGDTIDYFYGSLAPSTGYINLFDLRAYENGLLLQIPNRANPIDLEPIVDQPKMYNIYKEGLNFLNIIGLDNVGDLNKANLEGRTPEIIKVAEALQEKEIANIAALIARRFEDGVRIVLLAGPSSSGKTTTRLRLEVQLMTNLIKPVGLSLDDYFVNREDTPLDENGEYDFESLYALDLDLFNCDLKKILKGEKVSLPSFNFATGKREYKGKELKLEKNSVLVIEGIHGLNPALTAHIPDERKFRLYVSALTAISLDDHNWIPTTDNRLLRRLVRDFRYRGYSAIDTLSRWPSVRKGEDKWIFPFQENADIMFNSAMIYELAALRRYAEPILQQVPNNVPEYAEAYRLLKFLSYFEYINDNELPPTSLLREFLGGSSFKY